MKLVLSCCLILCYIWLTDCTDINKSKACYKAKICIHNNNEKCGVNSNGRLRRFLDSCDIMEYNCLRGTDFVKTAYENCSKLPPMQENDSGGRSAQSDTEALNQQAPNGETSEETPDGSEKQLSSDEEEDQSQIAETKDVKEEDQAHIAETKDVKEEDQAHIAETKDVKEEDQVHIAENFDAKDEAHLAENENVDAEDQADKTQLGLFPGYPKVPKVAPRL